MSENTVESTEIAVVAAPRNLATELSSLSAGSLGMFTTVTETDFKSRVGILNALNNATPIADNIGKPFKLANVIIQSVEMADETTGELKSQPRITFIDSDGNAFHAISPVLYQDVKNIFAIMGLPSTWPEPLPFVVNKEKGKRGTFFTAKIAV